MISRALPLLAFTFLTLGSNAFSEQCPKGGLWDAPMPEFFQFLVDQDLINKGEGYCGQEGKLVLAERGHKRDVKGAYWNDEYIFQDGRTFCDRGMAFRSDNPSPFLRRHEVWHSLNPELRGCGAEIVNLVRDLSNPRITCRMTQDELEMAHRYLRQNLVEIRSGSNTKGDSRFSCGTKDRLIIPVKPSCSDDSSGCSVPTKCSPPTRGTAGGCRSRFGFRMPYFGGGISGEDVCELTNAIGGHGSRDIGGYNMTPDGCLVTVPQWWPWTDDDTDMRPYIEKNGEKCYMKKGCDGYYYPIEE